MKTAKLKVVRVAETRFALPSADAAPWAVWATDAADDASALAEFAGRTCYGSWSRPNPATRRNRDYLAHILESEHFSVLEHAGFTVLLSGVSRSFTHELVRHRHLSYSMLSQRFVDEADAAVVVPPLFRDDPDARAVLAELYAHAQQAYRRLVELGNRKLVAMENKSARRKRVREAARCVLPNMTETHIVVSGNHRAWRELFAKRGGPEVDPEIREVAVVIFTEVAQPLAPAVYQDFRVRSTRLSTSEEVNVIEQDPGLLRPATTGA